MLSGLWYRTKFIFDAAAAAAAAAAAVADDDDGDNSFQFNLNTLHICLRDTYHSKVRNSSLSNAGCIFQYFDRTQYNNQEGS